MSTRRASHSHIHIILTGNRHKTPVRKPMKQTVHVKIHHFHFSLVSTDSPTIAVYVAAIYMCTRNENKTIPRVSKTLRMTPQDANLGGHKR